MFIRSGVDIIEIDRIEKALERFGSKFLNKILTKSEIEITGSTAQSVAGRFSSKEAVSKALGTGFRGAGWREIEILGGEYEAPVLILHGRAKEAARKLGLVSWSVSISHSDKHIVAVAVALGESPSETNDP